MRTFVKKLKIVRILLISMNHRVFVNDGLNVRVTSNTDQTTAVSLTDSQRSFIYYFTGEFYSFSWTRYLQKFNHYDLISHQHARIMNYLNNFLGVRLFQCVVDS